MIANYSFEDGVIREDYICETPCGDYEGHYHEWSVVPGRHNTNVLTRWSQRIGEFGTRRYYKRGEAVELLLEMKREGIHGARELMAALVKMPS